MTAETLRAVRVKAELLNGGASLGEAGDAIAEMAAERALAYCQRPDVPGDMEQAVGALALALWASIPRTGGGSGEAPAEDEAASGAAGGADWEALLASGAVKTVQRGDTSITFQSGDGAAVSAALGGSGARPAVEAALEGLKPWRRLGRLKPEPPERRAER